MALMMIQNQRVVNECLSLTGTLWSLSNFCVTLCHHLCGPKEFRNQQVVGSNPTGGSKDTSPKSSYVPYFKATEITATRVLRRM